MSVCLWGCVCVCVGEGVSVAGCRLCAVRFSGVGVERCSSRAVPLGTCADDRQERHRRANLWRLNSSFLTLPLFFLSFTISPSLLLYLPLFHYFSLSFTISPSHTQSIILCHTHIH